MRLVLNLLLALLWAPFGMQSQVNSDCDPDFLLAVDDTYFLQEEDLPLFNADLLSNDIIGLDYDGVSIEGFIAVED